MGKEQNRKRRKKRKPPWKRAKKFKDGGEQSSQNPGPSQAKLGDSTANFVKNVSESECIQESTIFIDIEVLFGVFSEVLKSPDCGDQMTSHIDVKKKNGFSHIVLECVNTECDWKHCFHSSQKQGPSYTVNTRAVLAFREIGQGHGSMTTFAKIEHATTSNLP